MAPTPPIQMVIGCGIRGNVQVLLNQLWLVVRCVRGGVELDDGFKGDGSVAIAYLNPGTHTCTLTVYDAYNAMSTDQVYSYGVSLAESSNESG